MATHTEAAQLLQDIAQQIQALAVAHEVAVRRAQLGIRFGPVAVALALVACILAIIW